MNSLLALADAPQGAVDLAIPIGNLARVSNIAEYVGAIFRYGIGIVGVIATVMIVVGGVQWLIAAGDPGKITQAKERITNAVIGLILMLGTTLLLNTINPEILKLKALKIPAIAPQRLGATTCPPGNLGCLCSGGDEYGDGGTCQNSAHKCVATRRVVNSDIGTGEGYSRLATDVLLGGLGGQVGGAVGAGAAAGLAGAAAPAAGAAAVAALPVAVIAAGSTSIIVNIMEVIGHTQYRCTDGGLFMPCDETGDCRSSLKCHDDLHICFDTHPPPGGLCDDDDQCPDDYTCPNNYCRGDGDPGDSCNQPSDCAEGNCIRPERGPGRCQESAGQRVIDLETGRLSEGTYCRISGGLVQPSCSPNTCLYYPPSGRRVWIVLDATSDPDHTKLGQCKPSNCAGLSECP